MKIITSGKPVEYFVMVRPGQSAHEVAEAINDPAHEEHADMLVWSGGDFDPTAFDIDAVNARLQRLKR